MTRARNMRTNGGNQQSESLYMIDDAATLAIHLVETISIACPTEMCWASPLSFVFRPLYSID